MLYQKPEIWNLTSHKLHNESLQIKLCGQKGLLHGTQELPVPLWGVGMQQEEGKTEEQSEWRCDGKAGKIEEQRVSFVSFFICFWIEGVCVSF